MKELRNLIMFFVRNFPRRLGRTELVKLIYLFEYNYYQIYQCYYSNVEFRRDNYGPFAPVIIQEAEALTYEGAMAFDCYENGNGGVTYEYWVADNQLAQTFDLFGWEKELALNVIRQTEFLDLRKIKNLAYNTPPMDKILKDEEKAGVKQLRRVIDMSEHKPFVKFSAEELKAAKKRLDAEPDRGSDQEYYSELLKEFKGLETLRRRANECLLLKK
ncbi:MAG: hypothetical protein M1379_00250 [Firmicutes bacterium]|nr:hypothetical protein [Bacillota bacterium]